MIDKLTFVTSYPLGAEPVIRNRLVPYILSSLDRGHTVTLVSPDAEDYDLFVRPGFTHIKVASIPFKKESLIQRAGVESRMAFRLLGAAKLHSSGKILVTVPSMFLLFFSFLLGRKDSFLDLRDLTWEYVSEQGRLSRLAKCFFRFLAKIGTKQFQKIAVTNQTEYEYLRDKFNVPEKKICLVANGVSRSQFERLSPSLGKRGGGVVVSYIGNVGIAQNLTMLIDVALKLPDVDFNIIGDGSDYQRVKNYKVEYGANNVNMSGRVDWDLIPEIYGASDILYAQLSDTFSSAMPSKLYEYLSTGKYVVYGGGAQAEKILRDFDNVMVIRPDDSELLFNALLKVVNNETYRNVSMDNRGKIGSNYIREDSVATFLDELET